MNKILLGAAMVLGLGVSGLAQASGAFTGRVGLTAGAYDFDDEYTDTGGFIGPPGGVYTSEDSNTNYGVLLGTGIGVGRFFTDLGIEFTTYAEGGDLDGDGAEDDFFRTDGLLTLGVFVGDRWSVFGGYRHATFGDGFFSDDYGNTEDGPFLGGGVSFRAGNKVALGASLAYNRLTLSVDGQNIDDLDLNGVSAKLQMSFLGTPHALFLRWQHFQGDVEQAGIYAYEYTENYLNLGYQATFDFKTW